MNELLDRVLDAHGGLDAWTGTTSLTAKLSLGGPFWGLRGWPEVYTNRTVRLDTRTRSSTTTTASCNAGWTTPPDVTGNLRVAHYTHDPKGFDGFVFPTRRRVHLHDAGGVADQSFAPITLDVASVTVAWTRG